MSSTNAIGQDVSDEQAREQNAKRRTSRCDKCGGRLVREQIETVCGTCGLVVDEDALRRAMSPSVHKQGDGGNGPVEGMTVFTALQDVVEDAASYDPYLEHPETDST